MGKRSPIRGLVSREMNDQGRRVFGLTFLAQSSYFPEGVQDALDVTPDKNEQPAE